MDLRTLRYCEAIVRLGSMTRAAEVLHVAQPALSVAIKKLEEELGVTLFARQRNRRVIDAIGEQRRIGREARVARDVASAVEARLHLHARTCMGRAYGPAAVGH